jgi:hypothetical protein
VSVRELLRQAQITPMTYQTLVRHVSFMGRWRKGQDGFRREHLLALKAFALLRAHGLRISIAAGAVEEAFPAILKFTNEGTLPVPEAYKIGVRLMTVRGRIVTAPIDEPMPLGTVEVGRVEFDLRGIAALLPVEEEWIGTPIA